MKKLSLLLIFSFLLFTMLFLFSINSKAEIIYVDPGDSIQDAINSANPSGGDTVYVNSSVYTLTATLSIDRPLNLIGQNKDNTIISYTNNPTIQVTANGVKISDLTIRNSNREKNCILLDYGTSECIISDNTIESGINGVSLLFSNDNTIKNNLIKYNENGIYLTNSDSNNIESNSIENSNSYGIFLDSSDNNIIKINSFQNSKSTCIKINLNSIGNTIYLNDFNDGSYANDGNAIDDGSNNWDYGSQGNYWDDYNDYDSNSDGIGDTPYNIGGSGGSKDNYPLGDFLSSSQTPIAYIDSISPNPATEGSTVSFSGHGTDDGTVINWKWESNIDGVLSFNAKNYQTSTLSEGSHTITFRVMDNEGYWSEPVNAILVINQANQKPYAFILDPTSGLTKNYGEAITFQGGGSDDGQIVSYIWRSSLDGYLSNAIQFTKNDLSVGQHTIYLKVRDDYGEDSAEDSIEVIILSETTNNPPIPVSGGPYSGIANQSVTFDASDSYDPDLGDSITSYLWNFGDGSTGEGKTTTHIYSLVGEYTIELTVTDTYGEQRVVSTYVNISSQAVNGNNDSNKTNGDDTPGFETILIITAVGIIFFYLRKKRNKKF